MKEGLAFDFKSILRQPNTLKAHALVAAAQSLGVQSQVKEELMKAYFCEGADLTQNAQLLRIANRAGMPTDTAQNAVQDTAAHQKIAAQDTELRRIGISGVPHFIINRGIGISGAQAPEALLSAFEQALANSAADQR